MPAPTLVLPFDGYDKAVGITESDEAEALSLLEKAGFPKGKGVPTITILIPEGGEDAARVADLMKTAWEKLPDIHVDVQTVPASSYFAKMRQGPVRGGYTLGITTWIGDFADPLAFLGMFTSDSNLNDPRYSDSEYDKLLLDAAGKDGDARLEALAAAETHLLAAAPILPLYHNLAANVIDTGYIQGWFANALDLHPFKYLSFGEKSVRSNVAQARLLPAATLASLAGGER
jgi:oligopeptide transport system substrate-binding protein